MSTKGLSRRALLNRTLQSALAWSMRSAVTGLPVPFLLSRSVEAAESAAKVLIISQSAGGEGANVNGPGTYGDGLGTRFQHPQANEVDAGDVGSPDVNGMVLSAADLQNSAELALGEQPVRMARAYQALLPETRAHMVWFQHRTDAGIHPEFASVLKAHGRVQGAGGRGAEELPSAIAQETASLLGTTTEQPFVLGGGGGTFNGAPMPTYSPTQAKTLANSVGGALGGAENFDELYEHFIDRTYADVKAHGTPVQKRYLDRHASSRKQALAFGERLAELLEAITDDSIESQLKTAAAIAKLKLAPVVVTGYSFGGDNHSDSDLTIESGHSLSMIRSLDAYWKAARDLQVLDSTLYATLTVFGRDTERGAKGGRGHNASLCSGIILGKHVRGGVVGGIADEGKNGHCTGINTSNGSSVDPDVAPDETLDSYYRTLMRLSGVPVERREVRLPTGKEVRSLG